ncbi:MAG: DUF87 domain-containing protein [Gammaproteobacteria bacterium]|nr:DUF87 domain-containing protein [Gammaproteobacteria bacterium]
MLDYEKLGAFYLGKRVDEQSGATTEEVVLYDARDLTTHAVIIGMTGSGKTGLGISLLEEAAMDHIPVIAIDPKGDLGNILLTFPGLAASDFRPWINARQAADNGQSEDEFAAAQAELWKQGLAQWGQDGERIARMRQNVDLAIYTPGSSGLPISVLQSFNAPSQQLIDDADLYRDRIQAVASGLLSLLRIDADPVSSREHILISRLLDHNWQQRRDLGVAELIAAIQNPPLQKVGVMDIDSFYPAKERFALAMKLNNLLAAPGFAAWTQGVPLNAGRLLYTDAGKPRISVLSIAHLDDTERMFFVAMLLNELIGWMRAQPGTASLRAILYMDEIFGFVPPVENPPSKKLLLTLLKQARAYGLGVVLATQNPVDLDYRGLSNTGTWMIGRLQTERDKARVMEGLEGISHGGAFDRQKMEQVIAGLGKRRFLLHNVHEDAPVVFNTRWAMSYLAGPLTREQIRRLVAATVTVTEDAAPADTAAPAVAIASTNSNAPLLPPGIEQYFVAGHGDGLVYYPRLLAVTDVAFSNARYRVDDRRETTYIAEFDAGALAIHWDAAEKLPITAAQLQRDANPAALFTECPASALQVKNYSQWQKQLHDWLRKNESVTLYQHKQLGVVSEPGETEGRFRSRLQVLANERRDAAVSKIRQRYAGKAATLENRLLRAEQAIQREQQQASTQNVSTAISFGTAILGAVLGRKRLSATTASKLGTAMNRAGGARKQAGDVARARQTADAVRADLVELSSALEAEIAALGGAFSAQDEPLVEIPIRPKATDVHISLIALVWLPYRADDVSGNTRSGSQPKLQPAW